MTTRACAEAKIEAVGQGQHRPVRPDAGISRTFVIGVQEIADLAAPFAAAPAKAGAKADGAAGIKFLKVPLRPDMGGGDGYGDYGTPFGAEAGKVERWAAVVRGTGGGLHRE